MRPRDAMRADMAATDPPKVIIAWWQLTVEPAHKVRDKIGC